MVLHSIVITVAGVPVLQKSGKTHALQKHLVHPLDHLRGSPIPEPPPFGDSLGSPYSLIFFFNLAVSSVQSLSRV